MRIEFHTDQNKDNLSVNLAAEEVIDLLESLGFTIGEPYNYETRIIHVQYPPEVNPVTSVYYRVPFWRKPILWQEKPVGELMFQGSVYLNENKPVINKLVIGSNDLSDRENFFVSDKVMQALAKHME